MALVKAKTAANITSGVYDDPVASKIQRRRYQILVHSLLYYELDINLVSDHQWQSWAQELVALQKQYPEASERVIFYEAFRKFDGSSGYHLPYKDHQVVTIASRLLQQEKSAESEDALEILKYRMESTPAEYEAYKKRCHSAKASDSVSKEVSTVEQKPRKGLFSVPRK